MVHTVLVTTKSATTADPGQHEVLRGLLSYADAVLFDFDGPVCDLFGQASTAPVAEQIKTMARRHWGVLDQAVEDCHDSHGILQYLRDMLDKDASASLSRAPLKLAHDIVTGSEYAAVNSAEPAPRLTTLLDLLSDLGKPLVVVSNNAEEPVWEYLKRRDLQSYFKAVCGRDPFEPRHMKPAAHSVHRALERLDGVPASKALMVGDQLTDLAAAKAAEVGFLGYARDEPKARAMEQRGADCVVASHDPVIAAALELLPVDLTLR